MRVFVAIDLPASVKDALSEASKELRRLKIDAKFPSREGTHLTLKFLGEVEESLLPEISSRLRSQSTGCSSFDLKVCRMGVFPHLGNPRVVWAGVAESEPLSRLQAAVANGLADLSFAPEGRSFHPHLTLARVRSRKNIAHLIHYLESRGEELDAGRFIVSSFQLFQSILSPQGARYRIVESFPLIEA